MMKRGLTVGKILSTQDDFLLWTIGSNTTLECKILCDSNHIISGELCHLFKDGKEIVWEYLGEGDPCFQFDVKPRFSIIIPMLIKFGDEKVQKNVRFPKSFSKDMERLIINFSNDIQNLLVTVKRDDTNGKWAKYSIESLGKKIVGGEVFDQDKWVDSIFSKIFTNGTVESTKQWILSQQTTLVTSIEDEF